jgi:signal transduction histidine kinase
VASQWRIRHKLMLGVVLVVGTIALLLGGTLRGLWSYYVTINEIRDCSKELRAADDFHESVSALTRPVTEPEGAEEGAGPKPEKKSADPLDSPNLTAHIKGCLDKLTEYEKQLDENLDHGADADYVADQRARVKKLREGFDAVKEAADTRDKNRVGGNNVIDSVLKAIENRPVLARIAERELDANDLRNVIYEHLSHLAGQSRDHYQAALKIIIPTSIIGLLSIIALMRCFYRWIFYPIRDLEVGVKRVAQGDFDHRIELHSGDEMEDLAVAFGDMTRRLHDLYADLARQVNERSRQLVRSERLASVGFLAAGVAHEINNPLASIAFCSEALEARLADLLRQPRPGGRRSDDEEVFARYLRMIQEEAFRCKKITEKLLEFSRSSERRREPTDLAALVQSVIDITQHLQNCKGKQLVFEAPERVPGGRIAAPVNAEEIKSVVLNLVVNALDSMEEGGTLTIRLGLRDGMAEMHFTDTGCGMSQDVLENIFEPFFTRSRTGKGTGLGLTISHRIINQHGGEIEATSDGPGRGSTFVVRLPLTEREPGQAQPGTGERARQAA